jgi:hypothetical protein
MKTAYFNRFEIDLSDEAVRSIAHSGDNQADVLAHLPSVKFNEAATPANIRAELKEYGAWDAEELADDEKNKMRIVWIAAWNIYESDEFRQSPEQ